MEKSLLDSLIIKLLTKTNEIYKFLQVYILFQMRDKDKTSIVNNVHTITAESVYIN